MPDTGVIGSGVIGLTSAIALANAGHRVRMVYEHSYSESVSSVAAAFWFPYLVGPIERTSGWALASYSKFREFARLTTTGVFRRNLRVYHPGVKPAEAWWMAVDDFRLVPSNRLPANYDTGYEFSSFVVEMPKYLTFLMEECKNLGVRFVQRKLNALSDAEGDLIVNCTGMGARELAKDPSVYGVRGDLIRIRATPVDENIYFCPDDRDHPKYYVPRSADMIVGGTSQRIDSDNPTTPDLLESAAKVFHLEFPEGSNEALSGIRPCREAVRLESETMVDGRIVIHNYGHGGGGVTLSWGCAMDVVSIVQSTSMSPNLTLPKE